MILIDDFAKTGAASTNVPDRFGASNNAISLNGDHLTRPRFTYGNDFSISFWIKTSTDDTNKRRIIDHFSPTGGFYIHLENGKIGIVGIHGLSPFGQANQYHPLDFISNTDVADNKWHHITLTIEFDEIRNIANQLRGYTFNFKLYVDTSEESFVHSLNNTNLTGVGSTANTENVTIANNSSSTTPNTNRYYDAIDDIHVYNRILTNTEVITIAENDGFCFAPDIATLQITNITETTFDVSLTESGNFDIAYVTSGDTIGNATITNITSTGGSVHTITGVSKSSLYDVYVRKVCSVAYTSGWSELVQIRTEGTLFVSAQATGNNDGTSWANAYTNLQDAIASSVNNQEIWVTGGVYKPHTSNITAYFEITKNGTKIYGGFNGSETQLSQRDFRLHETIFSGDLLGNDDANITFTNGSRNDNSSKIIYVNAHDFTLNGITVSDGHRSSPGNSFFDSGTALQK